ncbi:MAG: aspartate 1-decarboxylase [Actinobacteria bacterium]|nr:aspartate 1-decarboxylase [Actinomycetota bacterium]
MPGVIGLNGAAARLVYPGDTVIIISYADDEDAEAREHDPTVVFVDDRNHVARLGTEIAGALA